MAELLRPGKAGSSTAAAGATKEFAAHMHELGVEFSVGASFAHLDVHAALAALPEAAWTPAYQACRPRAAEHGVQIETAAARGLPRPPA